MAHRRLIVDLDLILFKYSSGFFFKIHNFVGNLKIRFTDLFFNNLGKCCAPLINLMGKMAGMYPVLFFSRLHTMGRTLLNLMGKNGIRKKMRRYTMHQYS